MIPQGFQPYKRLPDVGARGKNIMNYGIMGTPTVFNPSNWMRLSFKFGILLKGISGLAEMLGGVFLIYFNPIRLNQFAYFLMGGELKEDPGDYLANALLHYVHGFSINAQFWGVLYLMSHGIIKCVLFYLLWQKKQWAYLIAIISLVSFIGYQIYCISIHLSIFLLILTFLDIIMVFLTLNEYRRSKRSISSRKVKRFLFG